MSKIIITCEHGGNKIPLEFRNLFKENRDLLNSHRGFDEGALKLAEKIAGTNSDYFKFSTTSRLLVELNRSPNSKNLFSTVTKNLNERLKKEILKEYYFPFRIEVENEIKKWIYNKQNVIHFSIHTFTPILNNKIRDTDIGLLYDPKSENEKKFCRALKTNLNILEPGIRIRFNYPYLGISDGLTSYLRKIFPSNSYMGIEIEVNQKFPLDDSLGWSRMLKIFPKVLQKTLISRNKD